MGEAQVNGRFYRRLSNANSDWVAQLVRVTSEDGLPVSVSAKKQKGKPLYITVVGYSLPEEDYIDVVYNGEWIENVKYGVQLKVKNFTRKTPDTKKGIVKYLSSKTFKGIGKATASLIVDRFGEDTLNIIRDNPERLLAIRGITKSKLKKITESFKEAESYNTLASFLMAYELSPEKINAINKRWGTEAVEIITANPHAICDIPGCGFTTAEVIAHGIGDTAILTGDERIKQCILYVLKQDTLNNGNIYSDVFEIQNTVMKRLNSNSKVIIDASSYDTAFNHLKDAQKIIIRSKRLVYLKENDESEQRPAHKLIDLLSKKVTVGGDEIDKALADNKVLSDKQKEAVKCSLMNRVSVITGGPGTGKTTILKSLIKAYEGIVGKPVTLLAPTGRAARRMAESTGKPASTIHSEIHLYQNDIPYGECVKLTEGLVVVDEMSMVDQFLMDRLMSCMPTLYYHLVLVGDVDQLESVGVGSVLREMINSGAIPVTRLTEVFRQAEDSAVIVQNANAVNQGVCVLNTNDRFGFVGVPSEEEAQNAILQLYETEDRKWGSDNVAILCPMRHRGALCVDELNRKIQDVINPIQSGEPVYRLAGREFRLRDRVIMSKNTEFASNGDIGILEDIVTKKDEDGDAEVYFCISWDNGSTHEYFKDEMQDIDLAYAITIHKSQGSEYASCIIPILSTQQFMLRRNLFYTAITRSKEQVTVVFDSKAAVKTAIVKNEVGKRKTLFGLRLKTYEEQSKNH